MVPSAGPHQGSVVQSAVSLTKRLVKYPLSLVAKLNEVY